MNPNPNQVKELRQKVQALESMNIGEAQDLLAEKLHTSRRAWQQWESPVGDKNNRRMHAAMWELACIKFNAMVAERNERLA